MKKILKISSLFLLLAIASCESDDKDPIAVSNGILLAQPATSSFVLTPETISQELVTLQWGKADYGTSTVPVYTIEVAKGGTNFANPITAVSSADPSPTGTYTWNVGYLNALLNENGFVPCVASDVDIRVKSTLGIVPAKAAVQYSNTVTINVTLFPTTLPYMTFATAAQDPATAPKVASSGLFSVSDYEGYMWLEPGLYKFHKPNLCGDFTDQDIYGDNGGGSLVADGPGYPVSNAGYYLVKADLTANTFSVRATTWNIYGSAKVIIPLGNTAMTYDATDGLWKVTANLGQGYGFKFRSNGNAFVLGAYNANSIGSLFAGPDVSYVALPLPTTEPPYVSELRTDSTQPAPRVNRSYTIALDLRDPRNYHYTVTAN